MKAIYAFVALTAFGQVFPQGAFADDWARRQEQQRYERMLDQRRQAERESIARPDRQPSIGFGTQNSVSRYKEEMAKQNRKWQEQR